MLLPTVLALVLASGLAPVLAEALALVPAKAQPVLPPSVLTGPAEGRASKKVKLPHEKGENRASCGRGLLSPTPDPLCAKDPASRQARQREANARRRAARREVAAWSRAMRRPAVATARAAARPHGSRPADRNRHA